MSFIETATRRRVTIGMMTLTLVLFGVIALKDLKVNLLPDLSYPTLTVRTAYVGAAPGEIENLLSEPIEQAVGVVKNVKKVKSISRTGQSDVLLEFEWGANMEMAALEVREKLEVLQLPLEAERPQILRFDPSTDPILRLGIFDDSKSVSMDESRLKALRRFADEDLKRRLEPIAGVAAVKISGGLEDEIQIDLDQERLKQLNLSTGDVITRLAQENVNLSGGRLEEGAQRYLVRTINQFKSLDDMGAMLITNIDGVPVRLRDVAKVYSGYKERQAIIRINAREAIEIAIYKEGDANTVTVAEAIKAELGRMGKDRNSLPPLTRLSTVDDQSLFIRSALDEVMWNALLGGLFSVIVIYIFLGQAWSTLIISLSLPVSIVATFFFMGQFNLSLNIMSLGGLALATGMVVDGAIVVLENISRLREKGMSAMAAAVQGTREVAGAVTSSILTHVAVFFPLVFVDGVAGQLFRDQALTVTIAMLISLVISLTLIPMLAGIEGRSPNAFREEPVKPRGRWGTRFFGTIPTALLRFFLRFFGFFGAILGRTLRLLGSPILWLYNAAARGYRRLLPWALRSRFIVLSGALLAFVGALAVVPSLGFDLIPQLAQGKFELTVKLPPGTPLAQTDALVRALQDAATKAPHVATVYGVSGSGTRLDANPTESGENIGRLLITLKANSGAREEAQATAYLRDELKAMVGVESKFARPALLSFATPLEIEIAAYDLERLRIAGARMTALLEKSDRFADVKSSVERGSPEIQIYFDQDRAAALGLTTKQISDQIVQKVRGEIATRFSVRDRKVDVLVRVREDDRSSVDDIRNLIVNPESDRPVTLGAVARVESTVGPSEIRRSDQERVALISANLSYGDLSSAVAEIRAAMEKTPVAAGVTVRFTGQSEELNASLASLAFALGLAIFLVYLVMASQFESLKHPFVIMFTIPLAIIGAVFALKLLGLPISVVASIGIILLAGIVVSNGIVLIDRVNQLREDGVDKIEAICQAAYSRLRPITMTTLTTLVGFLPLALGLGEGAEIRRPMAITVIGGLTVSSLLTLLVIPVLYDLFDRKSDQSYVDRAAKIDTTEPMGEKA